MRKYRRAHISDGVVAWIVVTLLFMLLLGCTSLGTPVTRDNSLVQMPHYTFTAPADQGWHIQRAESNLEMVVLSNEIGPFMFQIKLLRNTVLNRKMQTQPAKVVADDYRKLEEQTMIEGGVKRGQYQLENLAMGEQVIGGRTFYTMTYDAVSGTSTQRAALYLLFPKSEGNDTFIVAHYSETRPRNSWLAKSLKPDFDDLLQTVALR